MIAIIDYGLGNIKNVQRAINHLGYESKLTDNPKDIEAADMVILPGVGHFKDAMRAIHSRGLVEVLQSVTNKPVIGICLGMQLLYEWSAEGDVFGLKLIPGRIIPIETPYPVPHLGWNNLISNQSTLSQDVYFVHSYYLKAAEESIVKASAEYSVHIHASVEKDNVFACQFHPEKSSDVGLSILKNFVEL